jgi:Tfp pilus assembly protein PilF
VSRILERLRPERRDAPRVPTETGDATVVLETLSGRARKRTWQPLLFTGLVILAGIGILYDRHVAPASRGPGREVTQASALQLPRQDAALASQPRAKDNSAVAPGSEQGGSLEPSPRAPVPDPSSESRPTPRPRTVIGAAVPPEAAGPTIVTGARPSQTPDGTDPATSEEHFQRALRYQRSGDFDNALAQYRLVLKENQMPVEVHNNLGLLYQGRGSVDEAIQEFSEAIRLDPGYARARNNRGVALLQAGNVSGAIADFEAVVAADARNGGALVNLAIAQRAAGRPSQAQETLIRAISIDPRSAAADYNLASLYEAAGESARALDYYQRYLTLAGADEATRIAEVRRRCDILRQRIIQQ